MQEDIPPFQSLKEIGEFLKRRRKTKFVSITDAIDKKRNDEIRRFYGCAVNFEKGLLPKRGSVTSPRFDEYLDILGFHYNNKMCILDAVYSLTGDIKTKRAPDCGEELGIIDGLPAGDLAKRLELNLPEMIENGEDAVQSIEIGKRHNLCLDELAYIAGQVINSYDCHTRLVYDLLERGRRTEFFGGLIGSTRIGIVNIQECAKNEPVDLARNLSPTLNSLILKLESRAKKGYASARVLKENLESSINCSYFIR